MPRPHPFASLPLDRLVRRIEADGSSQYGLVASYTALFEQRADSPAELFAAISHLGSDTAAGAALVTAVLRATERGETVPASVDAHFVSKRWAEESWDLLAEWPGLVQAQAAVRALGPARGRAIAKRLVDDKYRFAIGWLLVPLFADDAALVDDALARLASWSFPSAEIAMGVSQLPLERLPDLAARRAALGDAKAAELIRVGIQAALARAAARREVWPASLDVELDVHEVFPRSGALFDAHAAPLLRRAVAALPSERASAWLDVQLGGAPASRDRVLAVVPLGDPSLAARAITHFAENPKAIGKEGWARLAQLAHDLGDAGRAIAAQLPSGKVRSRLEEALAAAPASAETTAPAVAETKARKGRTRVAVAKPSAAMQKAQRLAEQALAAAPAEPRTRITLLEARAGAASGTSRIGGPGFRLGDRRPRTEDGPMTHVFTLAVADVPTDAFGDAVAFALYVSDPRASDPEGGDAEIVALGAADLERGPDDDAPGDLSARAVVASTFDVPSSALDRGAPSELARALRGFPARAGGPPHWLQEPEDAGAFVLQFDARFAPINLGDGGVMYVFRDAAPWQSR